MYIRCTTIKSKQFGEPYKTHRLVETERINGQVKQHMLLNLGRHFAVPKAKWTLLAKRIEQLLSAQGSLFALELDTELEDLAQRYAAQIVATRSLPAQNEQGFETVSVDTLELVRPRRVGVEHLALHALSDLKLDDKMRELGFNRHQLAAAMGTIIARMAHPASELATYQWLQQCSGLGEPSAMILKAWVWIACTRYRICYGNTATRCKPIVMKRKYRCFRWMKR